MRNSRQARKRIGNIAQITSESFRDYRFSVAGKRHLSWPEAAGPDGSWSWYVRKELQMKHFPPRQRFNSHYIHVLILIEFNTILQRLCDTWTVLYTPKPRIDAMSFLCCATSHWILIHTSGGRRTFSTRKNRSWIMSELRESFSLLSFLALLSEVKTFLTRVDDIIREQFASISSTLGWLSSSTSSAFIECFWCLSFFLLGISHWLPYCWSIVGVLVDFVNFFCQAQFIDSLNVNGILGRKVLFRSPCFLCETISKP